MHKNGYAIEKLLKRKLCREEYDHLLFWSSSICHLGTEKPEFKYLIIGEEWLYTMTHPKRQLESRIHFSSILGVGCIGDLAKFLSCQITRNYNHICVEFIVSVPQKYQYFGDTVKTIEQNVKLKKGGKDKSSKKSTDGNDSNCKHAGDALLSDVKDERPEGNSENCDGNEAVDRVINITQRLHIYLNDNGFIGFEILQKAVRAWHQSHKGFKNMIKSLLHLQNFQIHSETNLQPTLSSTSTPSPSGTASTLNIEALVANATRRNTIAYSTTAMNEDLQQLMSMFKPFPQNGITSTLEVSTYQANTIDATLTDYLNKIDQWINRAKEINEILSVRRQNCSKFNYLFDEHLYHLESILNPVYQNYPKCFPVKLCDKTIKVLEILVTQFTSTLPEQPISNENPMTQIVDDLEGSFQRNLTTPLTQTSIRQQMKLVLRLLTSINSLLSFILPVYIESNDEKVKDKISLTINEILSRRKLKKIILHLIEHLTSIPLLINAFCVDVNDSQSSTKHNCYQIELEAWIRAYEMKRLDLIGDNIECSSDWLNYIDATTSNSPSTIRNILNKNSEIGDFVHNLNYQINCLLCELICNTSSASVRFSTSTISSPRDDPSSHEDWIREIIHSMLIDSKQSIMYLLDCLIAHACTRFNLLCSKVLFNRPSPTTTPSLASINPTDDLDEKESISTIIRSLFIIDWLTDQYPYLIQSVKEVNCSDLFQIFNSKRILALINKLNEKNSANLAQIKLIKCVLAALVSRLYGKLGRNVRDWTGD
ncbi:unnamed protein product [Trichobilharzia szidati]|nr:unnamed protein product [Trichobilharzia szidati]